MSIAQANASKEGEKGGIQRGNKKSREV